MIVTFYDTRKYDNIGNKGKFLMIMKQNGFNVPNGFILDSDCYDEIVKEKVNEIKELLEKVDKSNISYISEKLINVFENIEIGLDIEEQIKKLVVEGKRYAVRSSGTKEDLEGFSFAGQYETFLNVQGIENIKNAIINCYKSMFKERILSYLFDNNISLEDLKMAVIIQEMIDADYSGIAFTVNPLTGNDKEILMEVTKGLGENIVSGRVKPEQYYYDWYNDIYNVEQKNIYFDKKQATFLMNSFQKVQEFFGYPCDIEFAVKDGQVYLLQARNITKIKYSKIKDIWSTADFKDGGVSAAVCTPYMWSLYEYIWEYTLRKFIVDSGLIKNGEITSKLGDMFYGRPYWNMSIVKLAMSKIPGYKEREFDLEYGVNINYEGDGNTTKYTLKSLYGFLKIALKQSRILKVRKENAEKYEKELLEQYEKYKKDINKKTTNKNIKKVWYELTRNVYLKSESTYFWQIFINTVHQALYKESLLKYVNESEYLSLLSGIENISHLLPFYDMWELTRKIRNDKKSFEYWTSANEFEIVESLNDKKYYLSEVNGFIDKYGYHSDKELDVTYPCYYEEKHNVIRMIKDNLKLDDEYSPMIDKENQNKEYKKQLEKIKSQVSKNKYNKIFEKVINMRKMLWWREEFRDISTRFYCIIRVYTIKLAEKLVAEKVINDVNDIWMLKVENIWDFIDNKINKKEIKEIIDKNKKYYNSFRNYLSENEIGCVFDGNSKEEKTTSDIQGIGCNNGIVIANAKVINSLDEIERLEKGDILVTKFTDTGWTSKFAILSGIVTEYGGILCHAAIVSREYGIPCIVCCHDAMKKIKDGSKIKIDGTTGKIEIVEV